MLHELTNSHTSYIQIHLKCLRIALIYSILYESNRANDNSRIDKDLNDTSPENKTKLTKTKATAMITLMGRKGLA